jgi:RNA polymerase sigma-70 factor, ECF subfamily
MCTFETDAVRLAQQGDAAAFECLYRLHSARVYTLCLRVLGNRTEAEDLTREAFVQSFRNIQSFKSESAFSAALLRLTASLLLRRRAARNDASTSDVLVLNLARSNS